MNHLEYNKVTEICIRRALPVGDTDIIDSFLKIYSDPFPETIAEAEAVVDYASALALMENEILKRFSDYLQNNRQIDKVEYIGYFYKVMKSSIVFINETEAIPDKVKYAYNKYEFEKLDNYRFIHGEHPMIDEFEKYLSEQLQKFSYANENISFFKYLEQSNEQEYSTFIDHTILKKLDKALRPEFISEDSKEMVLSFGKYWMYNAPSINWVKKQKTLLYLLLKLNDNSRDVPGGKLSEFVSITFKVNGKVLVEQNVSKTLSKVSSYYGSTETKTIDFILKSIGA